MTEQEITDAYRQYGRLVARRCRRLVRQEDIAEDALQEVFVRLWKYGDAFRAAESKVAWLYRVADRCCFDRLDARKRRHEVAFEEAALALPEQPSGARAVEDAEVVLLFLDRFDDRTRQVAVHHYLDEMTQEEIATATGWSRQTVVKKLALLAERANALRASLFEGKATS